MSFIEKGGFFKDDFDNFHIITVWLTFPLVNLSYENPHISLPTYTANTYLQFRTLYENEFEARLSRGTICLLGMFCNNDGIM